MFFGNYFSFLRDAQNTFKPLVSIRKTAHLSFCAEYKDHSETPGSVIQKLLHSQVIIKLTPVLYCSKPEYYSF